MCDTLVVVEEDGVWFAKNSDREPGEAQIVERHGGARHAPGAKLRVTYATIDQARETFATILSRPAWMWGAEMGVNERGVAIGNEAVFTRVPVEASGLLGMDLVRLALERAADADEALDVVTWMLAQHGQGGAAGFRDKRFRYHSSFLIADPRRAWLLETAGRFWAAARVRGARSTSNVLTIGQDYDRLGPGTIEGARSLGLLPRGAAFDFRRVYADPTMGWLSGGDVRRACTSRAIGRSRVDLASVAAAMRDHAGRSPASGVRLVMPCAHASWQPTRGAGQTTATMVSRLTDGASTHYFTGTSAPCLSVLKPVRFDGPFDPGPPPRAAGFDRDSLFWRAERLHRVVLRSYEARRAAFERERAELEGRALAGYAGAWSEHRERVLDWTARAAATPARRLPRAFDAYWRLQSWKDAVA